MEERMKKIIVIGSPGAGKSVFSKKLRDITNIQLYHLDMLYHKKDGTHISKEELEEKLDENFKQVISNFSKEKLPRIYELLDKYKDEIDINIFKSRDEADNYIQKINFLYTK